MVLFLQKASKTQTNWRAKVEELETLPAGTKPGTSHHRSPGGERRGRRLPRRSSLKGREKAIVNQTNIETVSKATSGKLLRDGVERIWGFARA